MYQYSYPITYKLYQTFLIGFTETSPINNLIRQTFADIYYVKHNEFLKVPPALVVKRCSSADFVIDLLMCEEALTCCLEICLVLHNINMSNTGQWMIKIELGFMSDIAACIRFT